MWKNAEIAWGGVTVLDGTPAESTTLLGSVSGLLDVPAGVSVDVHGVLEDAVISGPGTVRVSGLIAELVRLGSGEVLASVGSVLAPCSAEGAWRVLQPCGTWTETAELVFPTPAVDSAAALASGLGAGELAVDLRWCPVPRD
ncbi:hypothetical protein ACFFIO_15545 [Citricoccus parietis]|uniref:Uncharacterized protein n=1 Tax=Citricoccus parietis TaxID=592307 RepID=A0ABV6F925_9MICC